MVPRQPSPQAQATNRTMTDFTAPSGGVPCTVCFGAPCLCNVGYPHLYFPPTSSLPALAHNFQPHPERLDILFCPCCGDVKQLPDPPS